MRKEYEWWGKDAMSFFMRFYMHTEVILVPITDSQSPPKSGGHSFYKHP